MFYAKPNCSISLADTLSKRKTIDLGDLRRLEARHRMKVKGKIRRDVTKVILCKSRGEHWTEFKTKSL